jgi:hypothetical protein
MDMPKPSADHKRLEKLAGIWKGTETMPPSDWDPKGGTADGTTQARVALDGFAVVSDYEQKRGGKRTYAGHGVFTWDAQQQQVVLHWFDSMGQPVDEFRGSWQGDVLLMQCKNAMGHWKMTYDLGKAGTLSSRMETAPDGKTWKPLFHGTYRRES